jgi:Response regulator containing CheY-like receiver domain and AraC-type DNA-binding domain
MPVKLMIAEDEDVIRNGIYKYIQLHTDRFDKIYLAKDGEAALDIIFKYNPEVALLDVQMPNRTGIEVLAEASKMNICPLTIILSGYDEFKYAQQALKYGAREYLLKPCRSSEILMVLHKMADIAEGKDIRKSAEQTQAQHVVKRATEYIDEHYSEDLSLRQVADYVGISQGYLSSLFKQKLDINFIDYVNQVRVNHACIYLQQNYFKTYEIAYKMGFNDEKYFSKVFKKVKGLSPMQYRKNMMEEVMSKTEE